MEAPTPTHIHRLKCQKITVSMRTEKLTRVAVSDEGTSEVNHKNRFNERARGLTTGFNTPFDNI